MGKVVELNLDGNLEQGLKVNLAISTEGSIREVEIFGNLPPAPELQKIYHLWKLNYRSLNSSARISVKKITYNASIQKHKSECIELGIQLKQELNQWLNASGFQPIWHKFLEKVDTRETVRILIRTSNQQLRRLPWHLWELLAKYPNAEIALAPTNYERNIAISQNKRQIYILAILGEGNDIDVIKDKKLLIEYLKYADITFIHSPSRQQLNQKLWEKKWDILYFAGHSCTNNDIGVIYINSNETLNLEQLRYSLKKTVDNGLKLAIFNSCDGLGLASYLERLYIPQIIVMREFVPDLVAQEFLKHFLIALAKNKDLYFAVRQAREKLEALENEFPNASWLPTIIQNPAFTPFKWKDICYRSPIKKIIFFSKKMRLFIYLLLPLTASLSLIILHEKTFKILFFKNNYQTEKTINTEKIINSDCPEIAIYSSYQKVNSQTNHRYLKCFAHINNVPQGTWFYSGSTTWAAIRKKINPKLKQLFPNVNFIYKEHPTLPPGSGTGIKMLLDGEISFALSSRPLRDKEYELANKRGLKLKQIPIAIDGIGIVVHPNLNIHALTIKQLKGIYSGKISNWNQLGGPNLSIQPYTPPIGSGATTFLQKNILEKETFAQSVIHIKTPTMAVKKVGSNENGGGIYLASARNIISQCTIKPLGLSPDLNSSFIFPYKEPLVPPENCPKERNEVNLEVFQNGKYSLSRRLFIIINQDGSFDQLSGEAYTNLLLTDEGQKLVQQVKFVPIRSF